MIIFTQTGWTGFQANLTAQLFNGLWGWGDVLAIGVVLAFVMVANNLFGFTGISVFARWIVAPLMLIWVTYLVIKGLTTEPSRILSAHPHVVSSLAWPAAVTSVIGLAMWAPNLTSGASRTPDSGRPSASTCSRWSSGS